MSFDIEEKRISDALDALDRELVTPDLMLGIRKKLDVKMAGKARPGSRGTRKPLRFVVAVAAVMAVVGITAAALSIGGFDWLLEKADPPFGDVVEAIEQSSSSQGIKVTAVAAQNYSDMAVLYVTLEDTEGLGRVTEDTRLDFGMNEAVQNFSYDLIYYDSETGIAAYQIRLGAPDTFDGQSLSLQLDGLSYGKIDFGEIRMDIDLTQAVSEGEHIGEPYSDSIQLPSENLTPGHVASIPGAESVWVSAIVVNHGYLTVQYGQPINTEMNYNLQPYLLDANGNRIEANALASGFPTDENLQPLRPAEGRQGVYSFMQYYFTVNTNELDGYTLCFEGSERNVITGDWNLDVDFYSIPEVLEVTADITVGGVRLTDAVLTISPIGMTLTGSGSQDLDYSMPMLAAAILETTNGDIELSGSTGFRSVPDGYPGDFSEIPYELIWHASSTIDMDSVIAVRIGDNRIPLR